MYQRRDYYGVFVLLAVLVWLPSDALSSTNDVKKIADCKTVVCNHSNMTTMADKTPESISNQPDVQNLSISCKDGDSCDYTFRIINGDRFPYIVPYLVYVGATRMRNVKEIKYYSGVIVNDYWILTTASTLFRQWDGFVTAYIGFYDRFEVKNLTKLTIPREHIYVHPKYDPGDPISASFDLAMLYLPIPIPKFSLAPVSPIPFKTKNDAGLRRSACYFYGWGAGGTSGRRTRILRRATVKVRYIKDRTIMVVSVYRFPWRSGLCEGDQGGPLICDVGGTPVAVGIMRKRDPSCDPHMPVLFVRLHRFQSWIAEKIEGSKKEHRYKS